MGFVLLLVALFFTVLLTVVWFPINIVWSLINYKKRGFKILNQWLYFMAMIIDIFAAYSLAPLLNRILIKGKLKYFFGQMRDTLSYVIAVNWVLGTLTPGGRSWAKFLIWIDYPSRQRGSNHLIDAIENKRKAYIDWIDPVEGFKTTKK